MDGKSHDILADKLNKLKEIIPEAFADGKLDLEKLRATIGEDINFENERYHLNWAGKSDAFRVLQQRTAATLRPVPEESYFTSPPTPLLKERGVLENGSGELEKERGDFREFFELLQDESGNIFIEGENLEVLKVLQKSYFGKIKMIYIDPPYNTGNDSFIYPDKFSESKEEYLKRIGDKSEEGYLLKEGFFRKNSKDGGHYHSNWLSMMYPRLYIARNLLRDDGVIFVSIDDNEVHNLRMIMNEIFGEENFISQFIWHSRQNVDSRSLTGASIDHEYVLCYSKVSLTRIRGKAIDKTKYSNPDADPRGPWMSSPMDGIATKDRRPNLHYTIVDPKTENKYEPAPETGWRFQKSTVDKLIEEKRILWPKNPDSKPRFKRYLLELNNEFTGFSSILETDFTQKGTKELRELMGGETLKFPKPVSLIKQFIEQSANEDQDIILDFFAGSGTTAQAVLELNKEDGGNRKFILVQLTEKTDEGSEAYRAGYMSIADVCKARIKKVIKKLSETAETKSEKDENQTELELKETSPSVPLLAKERDEGRGLGFQVFKLVPSNFKHWRSDLIESEEDLNKMFDIFDSQLKPGAQEMNMLYELMLKSGYKLTDKIEPRDEYYLVADKLAVVLSKINQKVIDEILKSKPQTCIILDNLFAGNDQLKTNTALQMKDAGVEMVVV